MTEAALIDRQRSLLRDLLRHAAERARAEEDLAAASGSQLEAAEVEHEKTSRALAAQFAVDRQAAEAAVRQARANIEARHQADREAARKRYVDGWEAFKAKYLLDREAALTGLQEGLWAAEAIHEGCKNESEAFLREHEAQVHAKRAKLGALRDQMRALLQEWGEPTQYLYQAPEPDESGAVAGRRLPRCIAEAERLLAELRELITPRRHAQRRLAGLFALLAVGLVFPLGWLAVWLLGLPPTLGSVLSAGAGFGAIVASVAGFGTYLALLHISRTRVRETARPLGQLLAEGEARCELLLKSFAGQSQRQIRASRLRQKRSNRKVRAAFRLRREEIRRYRAETTPALKEQYRAVLREAARRRRRDLRRAERDYARRSAGLQRRFDADRQGLEERHRRWLEEIRAEHDARWDAMAEGWKQGLAEVQGSIRVVNGEDRRLFPPWWDADAWRDWQPGRELPPVLRFGAYLVPRDKVPHAVPADERLSGVSPGDFTLPAFLPFPARASMLLQARGAGCEQAVAAMQGVMFRMLTAIPAGKVRFAIVDPVGMGQNFAGFMQLADHDPDLVGGRIWTEPNQIEARLADLTAHMENVIQKYLRNRYPTIADYNADAGEVAEPYRVLVVANFPAHVTDEAAKRLVRIAQSGPRCGVYVLVSVDCGLPLPREFSLPELERACVNLVWEDGLFRWDDPDFGPFPLRLDLPPEARLARQLLDRVGHAAREARRVEVPFETVAPPPESWWSGDSSRGLAVPLGRAGAHDNQVLRLGQGTSQHVLVAGKTGSGKSTLLHILVTNAALAYSPGEVEFYLIDFKKGVEFKTYATHELPHARVVAIESEREFGLSVLQRLDNELKRRGELFRQAGAQDLPSYRQAGSDGRMPRIVLVVDEFQEFFVEDDRVAQDAAQLLDRLVRQGRAFGLHVLLGSQTLGGAYSLARSTIDQMAVRIALQCSEADAQLILSPDNTAAKLLSRPGEAIYNDANGQVDGNHPFQVVWLSEAKREAYLDQLRARAAERQVRRLPLVVFEGNAPADITRNQPLEALLRDGAPAGEGAVRAEYRAYLGESLAIGEPTAAVFRRQNGSNLLVVGQQEQAAAGVLSAALISLGPQLGPAEPGGSPPVVVVDGSQAGPPERGLLARLPELLPCPVRRAGWRETGAVLADLTAEMERRQAAGGDLPPTFLVLYALHRLRDLRRQDDDYGFMRKEAAPTPPQLLANLLRDGPGVGVHVLIWCDTLNNLQRAFDRQAMRELALRVVFQMSVADSSNLIDSPLANRLGLHRAYFLSEEEGRLEKFRPYGPPPEGWLAWVKQQTAARAAAVGTSP
jgi:hypothetical protein